jgi:large subunit ribosomal protein L30
MAGKLRVTQVKSTISHIARNRATIRALGLKRIGHTVEIADNPATRGMVRQVRFLVSVEEVDGAGPKGTKGAAATETAATETAATGTAPTGTGATDAAAEEKA